MKILYIRYLNLLQLHIYLIHILFSMCVCKYVHLLFKSFFFLYSQLTLYIWTTVPPPSTSLLPSQPNTTPRHSTISLKKRGGHLGILNEQGISYFNKNRYKLSYQS